MVAIKFLGGVIFLSFAIFMLLFSIKIQKQDSKMDESIHRSIGTQGYVFAATLLMFGVYLIIAGINDLNASNEKKTNQENRVIIHRKK